MKKKIFNVLLAVVLGVSFSLMAAPAIASSVTLTINENPSPVFPPLIPDQAYVIRDNVNYKLYYTDNESASIRLAQSPDGITWTPYGIVISGEGYHADVKYYSTGFTGANSGTDSSLLTMHYRMWYGELSQNSIAGWRYAESPDGINWYNRMPVTQGAGPLVWGPHMGVHYGIADAIYTPGASNTGTDWTFRIYANAQWEDAPYSADELVVMAFSRNGYEWIGYDPTNVVSYATPVFTPSLDPSRFDCDHIGWFKVIKNSPTDWEAFYSGGKLTTYKALNGIGYATSTDGIHWTRRQTLFTTSDGVAWRSQSVWMPSVVKTGSNYQIWFLGSDNPNLDSSDWIQWKLGEADLTVAPPSPPGGGGGGDISAATLACPLNLVTNMQGTTTVASMSGKGVLCEDCIARDASGKYVLELDKDTKVALADNAVPLLLIFRESSAPAPAPENTAIIGPVYEISAYPTSYATVPSPLTMSPPATLTLTYDPKKLPKNATEVFIASYTAGEGWLALAPVPGVVAELGKAQALASHFSPVAVLAKLAEPTPAKFEVNHLTVSPPQAQPNQKVTISINVTNTGGQNGDYSLAVNVDGRLKASKQVNLVAGTSQTVNFTTTGYAAGKHQVEVAGLTSEFEIIKVTQPTNMNRWFIGGVIAIILLAIILLVAWRR